MTIDFKSVLTVGAVMGLLSSAAYAAWKVGEVTQLRPALIIELRDGLKQTTEQIEVVMDLTQKSIIANARQDFLAVEEKMKRSSACKAKQRGIPNQCDELSWEEKRDLCLNSAILEWPVEGSYGITCTKDGKPDLVERVSP